LRSAACYYTVTGDPERANALLNQSARTPIDPWLAAAEIATATAAFRDSKVAKRAWNSVVHGDFHPTHVSELASAVGTLELKHGNEKRSKKLFRTSLENPNENAVAQAQWVVEHKNII